MCVCVFVYCVNVTFLYTYNHACSVLNILVYVCMYVNIYVYMYDVCMCVCIYICMYINVTREIHVCIS